MRAHGHPRLYLRADAVLGDAVDCRSSHRWIRRVDHFRINTRAHGLKHGLAGAFGRQIDRASAIEIERNASLIRGDQSENYLSDIAPGEIMRFEWITLNFNRSEEHTSEL